VSNPGVKDELPYTVPDDRPSHPIPKADITGFTVPAELIARQYAPKDRDTIIAIHHELTKHGAVDSQSTFTDPTASTISLVNKILDEANRAAQSEKDIHPHLYDQGTMNVLDSMDKDYQGDENPLIDDLDEYGNPW
jgi:hypothetical protein